MKSPLPSADTLMRAVENERFELNLELNQWVEQNVAKYSTKTLPEKILEHGKRLIRDSEFRLYLRMEGSHVLDLQIEVWP